MKSYFQDTNVLAHIHAKLYVFWSKLPLLVVFFFFFCSCVVELQKRVFYWFNREKKYSQVWITWLFIIADLAVASAKLFSFAALECPEIFIIVNCFGCWMTCNLNSATCFPFLWAALRKLRSLAASTTFQSCKPHQRYSNCQRQHRPLGLWLIYKLLQISKFSLLGSSYLGKQEA